MQISNKLADMEVLIYSVGCEPALSNSPFCKDFFMALSLITGGRYVPLANAKALPAVIIGGAEEELQLDAMAEEINRFACALCAFVHFFAPCVSSEPNPSPTFVFAAGRRRPFELS